MRSSRKSALIAAAMCCILSAARVASAANTYYVAPTGGSDSNNGSIGAPFATFTKAISTAMAGDTIYARGGTYNLSSTITIGTAKNGTAGNPIRLLAYPGETPILDFRGQPYSASNNGLRGIDLQANFWHIKGLTVQYAADNGVFISGSNNTLEQIVARQNQDSGFQMAASGSGASLRRPTNNLLLNCDAYANFDYGNRGENADGFAVKFRNLGTGNVISGARAWNNGDDGMDFWEAENGITVKNSWVFHNGISSVFQNLSGTYAGDGNGIKLGHDSGTHLLHNLLVWGHPANGVDVNGNATELETTPTIPHGVQIYNVTAAMNGSRNFRFDEDPTTANPPTTHVLKNNISFSGTVLIDPGNTTSHNTFSGPGGTPAGLGVTAADFVSTANPLVNNGVYYPAGTGGDRDGTTMPVHATGPAVAPRLADGSLPPLDFLKLAAGSHLIDAGTNVGLPFHGAAPDLGWLEYVAPGPALPGDYNGDNAVDAADFVVWLKNNNSSATLPNDVTSGTVDESDYMVWRENYGRVLGAGVATGISAAAVPEPYSSIILTAALIFICLRRTQWLDAHGNC